MIGSRFEVFEMWEKYLCKATVMANGLVKKEEMVKA